MLEWTYLEGQAQRRMPAAIWMTGPDNPLREDEVDHKQQHHPCGNEDLRCDRNPDVHLSGRPYDAHDTGGDSSHAEPEHHAGHEKFVTAPLVQLEDSHVGDGAENEEDEEDSGDGYISMDGRHAAQAGTLGSIRRSLLVLSHALIGDVSITF